MQAFLLIQFYDFKLEMGTMSVLMNVQLVPGTILFFPEVHLKYHHENYFKYCPFSIPILNHHHALGPD